jgi:hypothetical protein
MSQVKHKARDKAFSPLAGVKVGYAMDRAEEKAGPEDVGEQALMRGLVTSISVFSSGAVTGLEAGVDRMIGHIV